MIKQSQCAGAGQRHRSIKVNRQGCDARAIDRPAVDLQINRLRENEFIGSNIQSTTKHSLKPCTSLIENRDTVLSGNCNRIARVNRRAAGQQCVRQRRAAIVGQWAKQWVRDVRLVAGGGEIRQAIERSATATD